MKRCETMFYAVLSLMLVIRVVLCADTIPSTPATLGALYRQARSDQFYMSRYGADSTPLSSGSIGVRSDPIEHRDAAYFESRCITCDPNKSATTDRGSDIPRSRLRPRYDWYDDDLEDRRPLYRDRYDDYDRSRSPGYDYYDPYDRYGRHEYHRPSSYGDRFLSRTESGSTRNDFNPYARYGRYDYQRPSYYGNRYDSHYDRDRSSDRYNNRQYDRYNDRGNGYNDRGNGYDNLDSRYSSDSRYDLYNRRPYDDPYASHYDRYNRYGTKNDAYDRYDPYDKYNMRRPYDDRYDRYGSRGSGAGTGYGSDRRGYYSAGSWGPGYDRGYANSWNYGGSRDNWRDRDINRDRDPGYYRPRDYFYDSTAAPGGLRGTSYLHDRPESSTKPNTISQDSVTSSPQPQDNKAYKD